MILEFLLITCAARALKCSRTFFFAYPPSAIR